MRSAGSRAARSCPSIGTYVADAERLEERRRLEELAGRGLDSLDGALGRVSDQGNLADQLLEFALAPHVHRVEADVGEELRQSVADAADDRRRVRTFHRPGALGGEVGDRRCVAATVVVEDDDHPLARVAEVVERFVGHPAGHRAVADDCHDMTMVCASQVAGNGEAIGVAEDRRGVRVLDEIVPALLPRRVSAQPTRLAQTGEPALAAGDQLVHVRLMAGVPQQRVVR